MPGPEKIEALYSGLSGTFDLGTIDEFKVKILDPNKRKALYDAVSPNYDIGESLDDFEDRLGLKKKDFSGSTSNIPSVSTTLNPSDGLTAGGIVPEKVIEPLQTLGAAPVNYDPKTSDSPYASQMLESQQKMNELGADLPKIHAENSLRQYANYTSTYQPKLDLDQTSQIKDKVLHFYESYMKDNDKAGYQYLQSQREAGEFGDKKQAEHIANAIRYNSDLINKNREIIGSELVNGNNGSDILTAYNKLKGDYNNLYEYSKEYLKEFPELITEMKDKERFQQASNETAEENPIFSNISTASSNVIRAFTNGAASLLALPRTVSPNNEFGWTDKLAETTSDWITNLNDTFAPIPEKYNKPLVEKKDGEYNFNSEMLLPKTAETLSNMFVLLYGANKFSGGLKLAGLGARASEASGLTLSTFVNQNKSYYDEAIKNGLSPEQASYFSMGSSLMQGMLESVSPNKYFGKGSIPAITKKYTDYLTSGVSPRDAFKETSKFIVKEVGKENVQEMTQLLADKFAGYMANQMVGSSFDTEIHPEEVMETLILTTLATGSLAGVTSPKSVSTLERDALYTAALNNETYVPKIQEMVANGEMDPAQGERMINNINLLNKKIAAIPGQMDPAQEAEITSLIYQKGKLESENENPDLDDAFKKRNSLKIKELNDQILATSDYKKPLPVTESGSQTVSATTPDDTNTKQEQGTEKTTINQSDSVEEAKTEVPKVTPVSSKKHSGGVIMLDKNVGFAADLWEGLAKFSKKYLTTEGNMPKDVFKRKVQMEGATESNLRDIKYTTADFKRAAKEAYGTDQLSDEQLKVVDDVLKGGSTDLLPPELKPVVKSMRYQIDALSRKMVSEGLIEDKLNPVVANNLGVYMTRSYRVHDDPKWSEKVPTEVKNRAKAFIRDKFMKENFNYDPNGKVSGNMLQATKANNIPQITDEEVNGLIDELLYNPEAPMSVLSGSKLGAKDMSILKERKDIPVEIRDLMGEYKNPLVNYTRSVTKMVNLIEKTKFLHDVKSIGMDKFLFEKPLPGFQAQIAGEGSKVMNPLNGLYTSPEIAEVFDQYNKVSQSKEWETALMKLNGYAKASMTVGSFITHMRNMVGNVGFMVANGHGNLSEFKDSVQSVVADLTSKDDTALREKYKKYLKLGIVGENVVAAELRSLIKEVNKDGQDPYQELLDSKYGKIFKVAQKAKEAATDLYQAEDDLFKIYAFENEKARYQKAFPQMSEAEVEQKAADIVRATYPVYSLTPEIVKKLKKVPLIAPFLSFPAEVIRTTYNTGKIAIEELKDPATKSIGVKRASGLMLALTAGSVMSGMSAYIFGVSDEEDEDLKRFAAPWSKNSQFFYRSKPKDGVYKYIDLGFSDPHAYLTKPLMALAQGDDPGEGLMAAGKEIFSPLLAEEPFTSRMIDVMRNQKMNGKEVYNKFSPLDDQLNDISKHIGEIYVPGTFRSLGKVYKGATEQTNEYGKKHELGTELLAFFAGQRTENTDIAQSFAFKAFNFKRDLENARRIYISVKNKKGQVTPEQIEEARVKANDAIDNLSQEFSKDVEAATKLGVPVTDLKSAMKNARISRVNIYKIISGKPVGIIDEEEEKL
jgi:hypothetical protein